MKMIKTALILLFTLLLISGCSTTSLISDEELARQNSIDDIVSNTLFDHDIADVTSYKIRLDGHVIINFATTVSTEAYSTVVNKLRKNDSILGVSASQDGTNICALP